MATRRFTVLRRAMGADIPAVGGLLLLLVTIDLVLIGFYISMSATGRPGGFVFDIGADRSYGEFLQYVKDLWAIVLLAVIARQRRAGVYAAWIIVVAYLLVDDAFLLHERGGVLIGDLVSGAPSWAAHAGELVIVGSAGLVLAIVVALAHRRAAAADRAVSTVLIVLFAALIFFGVVVDGLPHLLFSGATMPAAVTVVEDGGEMIVLSLIVGHLFAVAFCRHQPGRRDDLGTEGAQKSRELATAGRP